MGIIWSRFKKKESTKDKLQKIQNEISNLEEYREHTEQRRKKLVGSLIAYSIFFYLIAAIIGYFYYLPPTLSEKLLYATPFIGFIVLIYVIKQLLSCYYRWKVRRNENKLSALKDKKAEILEQVMDTETYKVAKEILEIYAPEQIRKTSMAIKSPLVTPISSSTQRMTIPSSSGDVRRRIISPQTSQSYSQRQIHTPVRPANLPTPLPFTRPAVTPRPQQIRPNLSSSSSLQSSRIRYSSVAPMNSLQFSPTVNPSASSSVTEPPGPPMPRPILPRERGILDRFVEYLVGDGPSNRYALVCKQCESHNGMALKEEFPLYRCAYCFYWNPARKQKPAPPRKRTRV
ncbi:Protein lunapark [Armadillidium nasatum]|uniref:Endoplasmic reticulum junction formation protein lunapark n=1 Tax=Armadillidium nasatum TaxID=96803 RepID=A0A5N5TEZ1_9CRUS|nr:Protein lunapark [Armadillidium nasatum]